MDLVEDIEFYRFPGIWVAGESGLVGNLRFERFLPKNPRVPLFDHQITLVNYTQAGGQIFFGVFIESHNQKHR